MLVFLGRFEAQSCTLVFFCEKWAHPADERRGDRMNRQRRRRLDLVRALRAHRPVVRAPAERADARAIFPTSARLRPHGWWPYTKIKSLGGTKIN